MLRAQLQVLWHPWEDENVPGLDHGESSVRGMEAAAGRHECHLEGRVESARVHVRRVLGGIGRIVIPRRVDLEVSPDEGDELWVKDELLPETPGHGLVGHVVVSGSHASCSHDVSELAREVGHFFRNHGLVIRNDGDPADVHAERVELPGQKGRVGVFHLRDMSRLALRS